MNKKGTDVTADNAVNSTCSLCTSIGNSVIADKIKSVFIFQNLIIIYHNPLIKLKTFE